MVKFTVTGVKIKEEYVNPFLVPAIQVWEIKLRCSLDIERYFPTSGRDTTEDITAVIRVKGPLEGNVLYGFDNNTARSVASVMLGRSVEILDEVSLSAIGELADMISGSAADELAMAGYLSVINPPLMYQTAGLGFTPHKVKQIQVDFGSSLGALHVRIGLIEHLGRSQELSWLQARNQDAANNGP